MIRSKPKQSTLVSLVLFLILAYGIGIWTALTVPSTPVFWNLIPVLCLTTAVAITLKVLWSYQTIQIKGRQWKVKRLLRANCTFNSQDIEWWKETEIKTAGGPYRELHMHVKGNLNIKVSLQEHTEYQKFINMVKSKHLNKQIKEH